MEWKYGQRHPNQVRFPNHVLVLVEPPSRGMEWATKWWASERHLEDEYNYQMSKADIGGTKFDAVVRTYIIPRWLFTPNHPLMGSFMPNVPRGRWDPALTEPQDELLPGYVLGERSEKQCDDKRITSLFVQEQRTYIKRCSITDINADDMLGVGVFRTTNLYYRGELVDGVPVEDLFADPSNPFWGVGSDGAKKEGQQLSEAWFSIASTSSADDALLSYKFAIPGQANIQLPDVLQSIEVVWNQASGDGYFNSEWDGLSSWLPAERVQASLTGSEQASAEGSASIQPELAVNIHQPTGRNIRTTSYYFYMRTVDGTITDEAFLNRVAQLAEVPEGSVRFFPSFNAVSHTIILGGMKVSASAKASASAALSAESNGKDKDNLTEHISKDKNEGEGVSQDASVMSGTMKIPATIHEEIPILNAQPGGSFPSISAQVSCDVGWNAWSTGQVVANYEVEMPSTIAKASKTITAYGSIHPLSLPATEPASIPSSGLYVINSSIQPYKAGWVKCFAEVVDASNLM